MDLLDGVIGEFDDGLTSSAESEANPSRLRPRAGGQNGLKRRGQSEDKVNAKYFLPKIC